MKTYSYYLLSLPFLFVYSSFIISFVCFLDYFVFALFYDTGRRPIKAKPSGIQSGRIPNKAFTASTIYNKYSPAWLARLRNKPRGKYTGCWLPRHKNARQWIQVDLKRVTRIIKIATQGRPNANQYVTRFIVAYSQDRIRWLKYTKNGRVQVTCTFTFRYFITQSTLV